MRPKTPKNNDSLSAGGRLRHVAHGVLLLLIATVILLHTMPETDAQADIVFKMPQIFTGTPAVGANADVCPAGQSIGSTTMQGFTQRLVVCMKQTFLTVANDMLLPISQYFANFVGGCCEVAVILVGMSMMGGKGAPQRDALTTLVKIILVSGFASNFNGYFPASLNAMDGLLSDVTSYVGYSTSINCPNAQSEQDRSLVVWDQVDCALDSLIGGILSAGGGATNTNVSDGLIGFFVSALFSQTIGVFIAILGFVLIIQVIFAIIRAVYIFITAYLAFCFMILLSPLFIPLVLFSTTAPYFDKWLRLTLGFVLQPVFLFIFLAMMLAAYDTVVYTGENSIDNVLASGHSNSNQSLGSYLLGLGIYGEESQFSNTFTFNFKTASQKLSMQGLDTGTLGEIAQQFQKQGDKPSGKSTDNDASSVGNSNNVIPLWGNQNVDIFTSVLEYAKYIKTDIPTTAVDWTALSYNAGYGDVTGYTISLFMSFLMAVVTAYIFLTLMDELPYIGAGVASDGDAIRVPQLGTGNLKPPTDKLKERLTALANPIKPGLVK